MHMLFDKVSLAKQNTQIRHQWFPHKAWGQVCVPACVCKPKGWCLKYTRHTGPDFTGYLSLEYLDVCRSTIKVSFDKHKLTLAMTSIYCSFNPIRLAK